MQQLGAGAIMLRRVASGGGRGKRAVLISPKPGRRLSTPLAARGQGRNSWQRRELYADTSDCRARHNRSINPIGDGSRFSHLWERGLQHYKGVTRNCWEIAGRARPNRSPAHARRAGDKLNGAVAYRGLCTVEFLLDERDGDFVFMEAKSAQFRSEAHRHERSPGLIVAQNADTSCGRASLTTCNSPDRTNSGCTGYAVQTAPSIWKAWPRMEAATAGGT